MPKSSKKAKRWVVTNQFDPNYTFVVYATNAHNACIEALMELGWLISSGEEDERNE